MATTQFTKGLPVFMQLSVGSVPLASACPFSLPLSIQIKILLEPNLKMGSQRSQSLMQKRPLWVTCVGVPAIDPFLMLAGALLVMLTWKIWFKYVLEEGKMRQIFKNYRSTPLIEAFDAKVVTSGEGWYCPKSIEEFYELLNSNWFSPSSVKIVSGNTGSGVYKDEDLYDKCIDIQRIPELSVIKRSNEGLEIGAAVTISSAVEVLKERNNSTLVFNKIAEHLCKVASHFVQNTASIGGNIILAQRNQFASDIATILLRVGSRVCIHTESDRIALTLEEFLERPLCDYKTLLLSVFIPSWASSSSAVFQTYRAAPRPLGNAVAYVNSAFLAETMIDKESSDVIIENVRLAFGAYGTEHAIPATLCEAIRLLKETIVPMESITHRAYRVNLAVGFLFEFLSTFPVSQKNRRKGIQDKTPIGLSLSSHQEVVVNKDHGPVGEPVIKAGAEIQASGMFSN